MRLEPLPFRTRLVNGEGITSWAPRHALNNGSTVKDIDAILRRQGAFTSQSPNDSGRVSAWRRIGGLHERAFSEPKTVAGNWVVDRPLCERCTPRYRYMRGRLPRIGMVCVKHRRWLGEPQVDLRCFGEAVVAERHWRGTLTPRGIVVEAPVIVLAEECARVGLAKNVLEQRSLLVSVPSPALLVYPETVRLARLLSRTSFLAAALGEAPSSWKRAMVEREVGTFLPDAPDAENWRAVARVWDMVLDLQALVREARLLGHAPEDRWNLLRFHSGTGDEGQADPSGVVGRDDLVQIPPA